MARGTVLVVDDDPFIVEFMAMALEDEGYRVLASADEEALDLARKTHPDVILLDVLMPKMDGVEVSKRLRDDPSTAGIPIVAMSAQERLRTCSPQLPVNDLLPKPFHFGDLFAKVARWTHAA